MKKICCFLFVFLGFFRLAYTQVEKIESKDVEPALNDTNSCYDEFETEMINDSMKNFVPIGKGVEKKYRGKNVTFIYRELENNVGGELVLDGVKYLVNGIYEGEGMYFGAIWKDSQNFGVVTWSYGKCMSISYKNECEESEIEVCINNTNPFEGGVEKNENATGQGIGTPFIKFNKGDRTRLNDVNLDDLKIAENAVVSFRLIVNPDGKIERVETDTERTTTSNMRLIFEIRKRVIAQVRYSKSKGNDLEMFSYSITVSAD